MHTLPPMMKTEVPRTTLPPSLLPLWKSPLALAVSYLYIHTCPWPLHARTLAAPLAPHAHSCLFDSLTCRSTPSCPVPYLSLAMDGLPTPPNEELVRPHGLKKPHAASKSIKTVHRTLKRTTPHGHPPSPSRDSHSIQGDGRHKRVWKACERCRMKKTKVDYCPSHLQWTRASPADTMPSATVNFRARGVRTTG